MIEFTVVKINGQNLEIFKGGKLVDLDNDNSGVIPFRCKQGICGTCRIEILNGTENISPPTDEEKAFLKRLGYDHDTTRLACQIRVNGPIEIQPNDKYHGARRAEGVKPIKLDKSIVT